MFKLICAIIMIFIQAFILYKLEDTIRSLYKEDSISGVFCTIFFIMFSIATIKGSFIIIPLLIPVLFVIGLAVLFKKIIKK